VLEARDGPKSKVDQKKRETEKNVFSLTDLLNLVFAKCWDAIHKNEWNGSTKIDSLMPEEHADRVEHPGRVAGDNISPESFDKCARHLKQFSKEMKIYVL
jgi:hypothetical protein